MSQSTDVSLLSNQILKAERELVNDRTGDQDDDSIAVLFTGNWHDSVPRRLLVSQDLAPVEKTTWQIIRLTITDPARPGSTPRREELAMMVNCSAPTITTSRHMLRVCRWMTFCKSVRKQGRFVGEIYLLNDEPLSLASTLELDVEYIPFLESMASGNGNKRLRTAAAQVLAEIDQLQNVDQPTDTQVMAERISHGGGMSLFTEAHQSKIFAAVKDATPVENPENNQESGPAGDQRKNFATAKTHQRKNLSPVESKKFLSSRGSSCSLNNNKYLNISTRARGTDPVNQGAEAQHSIDEFRDLADIGRWGNAHATPKALLATLSPKLVSPNLNRYTSWLFAGKASTIAVIIRKLKSLPDSVAEMVMFQLIGREAAHFHGWSDPVRNPVGYATELANRARRNEFTPDEWALELYRAAEDGSQPGFSDSPDKALSIEAQTINQEADVEARG